MRGASFDLARLNKAPIAIEEVECIDVLFAIERDINGKPPPQRQRVRNDHSRPLATALETWLRKQRAKLSAKNEVAKAIARRSPYACPYGRSPATPVPRPQTGSSPPALGPAPRLLPISSRHRPAVTVSPEPVSAPALPAPSGVIEIEFANGVRLRITGASLPWTSTADAAPS
jgi:hypothetical protein